MLELGQEAPDFTAQTTEGEIGFHDWLGQGWGVLFSYPKAFTSVCGTELVQAARLRNDFASSDIKLAALSRDSGESQAKFGAELAAAEDCPANELMQIADPDGKIAELYGMIQPDMLDKLTVRTTYVIDPERKVSMLQAYPPKVSRDFNSILAAVRQLQQSLKG